LADWDVNGSMTAGVAKAWAEGLEVQGITGWRLPKVSDPGGFGCGQFGTGQNCGYPTDFNASELANMYYVTLGNTPLCTVSFGNCAPRVGGGWTNTAGFINMPAPAGAYWSSKDLSSLDGAWFFSNSGYQDGSGPSALMNAVAVHDGDVFSPVPEPAIYILMIAGLGAIGIHSRRRLRH